MSNPNSSTIQLVSPPPALKSGPSVIEQRIGEIVDALLGTKGVTKTQADEYSEAFTEALKAYVETPQGKKLKDLLLSKEVLPLSLSVIGAGLAAMILNKQDLPSVPAFNITKDLKIRAEIQSKKGQVSGAVIHFTLDVGKPPKKQSRSLVSRQPGLPVDVARQIRRKVDDQALRNWIIRQAEWEYETAGPREEARKRIFRNWVKNSRNRDFLPSMHVLGDAVAVQLMSAASQKRREVLFKLTEDLWAQITDRTGLYKCLLALVEVVVPLLGNRTGGVQQITFIVVPGISDHRGKIIERTSRKRYPIRIIR